MYYLRAESFNFTIMKYFISIYLAIFILLSACSNNKTEQAEENRIYHNEILGWSFTIPQNWDYTPVSEIERVHQTGKNMLEDFVEEEIESDKIINSLHINLDRQNSFQSYYEDFDYDSIEEWEEHLEELSELVYAVMQENNIKFDMSALKTENISRIPFRYQTITIYDNAFQPVLYQQNYFGIVNGKDLTVNINYTSDLYKRAILSAWRNSVFE
jgi:hypothetical protein